MVKLKRLDIHGFRSIRDTSPGLELGDVNVLIGANGSGKSNLIACLGYAQSMRRGEEHSWVGERGGGAANLYYGPRVSPGISVRLEFANGLVLEDFVRLVPGDHLMRGLAPSTPGETAMTRGGPTGRPLRLDAYRAKSAIEALDALLATAFHFHDTSPTARVHQTWYLHDSDGLKADGGNLAPVLWKLREQWPDYYRRLIGVIRLVAPWFSEFVLEPSTADGQNIILRWREVGSDRVSGGFQLSDGTLRFVMLATALSLPPAMTPPILVIDEPELGLHPTAIHILGELVRGAAEQAQVIMTTQSPLLVDQFDPEEVITVDRRREGMTDRYESIFSRHTADSLAGWLEDYSLGELWEKGVLGGHPGR